MARTDIYIAAAWAERDRIKKELIPVLEQIGMRVTSRWLDVPDQGFKPEDKKITNRKWVDYCNRMGPLDLEDIDKAHIVLFIGDDYKSTGGMFAEFGYALAKNKVLVWLGQDVPNVFVTRSSYFCTKNEEETLSLRDGRQPLVPTLCKIAGIQLDKMANMSKFDARRLMNQGSPS